jgi:hypothetical protein
MDRNGDADEITTDIKLTGDVGEHIICVSSHPERQNGGEPPVALFFRKPRIVTPSRVKNRPPGGKSFAKSLRTDTWSSDKMNKRERRETRGSRVRRTQLDEYQLR